MLWLLLACSGGGDTEPSETGDTEDTAFTWPDGPYLLGYRGEATIGETMTGWEEVYLKAEEGLGAEFCAARSTLQSTDVRRDCEDCDWAFDVVFSAPERVSGQGCDGYAHRDEAYGFVDEYLGHADVVVLVVDGAWEVEGYATDHGDGTYSWNWDAGLVEPD